MNVGGRFETCPCGMERRERNVDGRPQGTPLLGAVGEAHTGFPPPSSRGQAFRGENGAGAQGRTGMGEECVR